METILVTGCAGFIAARTCAILLERGFRVVGIDNLNTYYDVSLKHHRLHGLRQSDRFEFHAVDIEDRQAVREVFKGKNFAAILNLAARAGVRYSMQNPFVYMSTNAVGSLNLLEEMRERGINKYVLASTSSLYAGQPMPFTEDLPVNTPISPYAASKKAAELMAHAYHHLYGMDVSVVRYFTVYGPAGRPDMCIFRFIQWIDQGHPIELFGDGDQSRDFTYVDDIARGTIAAMKPLGYQIINLGGGKEPVSLNHIIHKLEQRLGKLATIERKEFHIADIVSTRANIAKARELLAWEPKIGIDEGLDHCVAWYHDNLPWSAKIALT